MRVPIDNASEVVREALRLTKESEAIRSAKLKWLKAALAKSEADFAAGRVVSLRDNREIEALFEGL